MKKRLIAIMTVMSLTMLASCANTDSVPGNAALMGMDGIQAGTDITKIAGNDTAKQVAEALLDNAVQAKKMNGTLENGASLAGEMLASLDTEPKVTEEPVEATPEPAQPVVAAYHASGNNSKAGNQTDSLEAELIAAKLPLDYDGPEMFEGDGWSAADDIASAAKTFNYIGTTKVLYGSHAGEVYASFTPQSIPESDPAREYLVNAMGFGLWGDGTQESAEMWIDKLREYADQYYTKGTHFDKLMSASEAQEWLAAKVDPNSLVPGAYGWTQEFLDDFLRNEAHGDMILMTFEVLPGRWFKMYGSWVGGGAVEVSAEEAASMSAGMEINYTNW